LEKKKTKTEEIRREIKITELKKTRLIGFLEIKESISREKNGKNKE
jgi:hypothetical protein